MPSAYDKVLRKCWPLFFASLYIQLFLFVAEGNAFLLAEDTTRPAQTVHLPVIAGDDLRFTRVSFSLGSTAGRVGEIVQDDQGFLWFGTQGGLERYDGYSFRRFHHEPNNPNSLSGSYIYSLCKDKDGKFWIGSSRYLDRFDPSTETFTHYGMTTGWILHILKDSHGYLWLSTTSGLVRLDPATGERILYQHKNDDPSSIGYDNVRSTLEASDGTFWVATGASIDIFDRATGKVTRHLPLRLRSDAERSHAAVSLYEDHEHSIWVAFTFGTGLGRISPSHDSILYYAFDQKGFDDGPLPGVRTIHEDADGTLWLGMASSGILRFDKYRNRFVSYRNNPSDPSSPSADQIIAMYEDREQNYWLGTTGGGVNWFKRKPLPFRRYRHEQGNPNSLEMDYTSSVFADSHGSLWVGSMKSLLRIDLKRNQYTFFRKTGGEGNLSATWIVAIDEDKTGTLWFGTLAGGLNRYDPKTGRFKAYRYKESDPHSLPSDSVLSIHDDPKGGIWVGTDVGLCHYDPVTDTFRRYPPTLEMPMHYRNIALDAEGHLWMGTQEHGLHRFDPATGAIQVYDHKNSQPKLSNSKVNAVLVDHRGRVWAGTEDGLNLLDPQNNTVKVYYEGDGLPSSIISHIVEDSAGTLWITTSAGLSHFDPNSGTFATYTTPDGLLSDEFYNFASGSMSPSGEIFFSSYAGVIGFNPKEIKEPSYTPPLTFTDFQLFGNSVSVGADSVLKQPISATKAITLSSAQSIFSLEFAALSFSVPTRTMYRYKLEGLEQNWNETDSLHRTATYTTLAPGHYLFRVQSRLARGDWNTNETRLDIYILPAWWQRWWFQLLFVLLTLLFLWMAHRWRLRRTESRNRQLREQIAEATADLLMAKEAAEAANEAKSTFLANMSHELRTPLNAILGFSRLLSRKPLPEEISEEIEVIRHNGEHLLKLINQILDLSKIESGQTVLREETFDLHRLLKDLQATFQLLAKDKGIAFTVDIGSAVPQIVSTDPLRLKEVLFNLLGNAFKFTERGQVELRVRSICPTPARCRVSFTVADTGSGISTEELKNVFNAFEQTRTGRDRGEGTGLGLTISRGYVRLMGGELQIESEERRGTSLSFTLPVLIPEPEEQQDNSSRGRVISLLPEDSSRRILVVDDQWASRSLLVKLLEPVGFEVRVAENGVGAFAIWQAWHPHLIFMDILMPGMDGHETTRRIRASKDGQSAIIVALTASSFENEQEEVRSGGYDAYLRKPFEEKDLFELLERHLGIEFHWQAENTVEDKQQNSFATEEELQDALAALPAGLHEAFHKAVAELDTITIASHLRTIREHNPRTYEILLHLTEDYRYGEILKAMDNRSYIGDGI